MRDDKASQSRTDIDRYDQDEPDNLPENGSAADVQVDSSTPLLTLLDRAWYWLYECMQDEAQNDGLPPCNVTQAVVLCEISRGVTRPSDIARELGLTRQAVSIALKQLEDMRAVEVVPDPAHKRASIARIRNDGDDGGQESIMNAIAKAETRLEKQLGRARFAQLKEVLAVEWGPVSQ